MINQLFRQYQKEIVKLANSDNGRKFLGIDHEVKDSEWITKLGSSYYDIQLDRNRFKRIVRCYPIFAKRLFYSLGQFDIFKLEKERNPKLYKNLNNYQGLLNYAGLFKDFRFPQIMLATTFYTGAGDGHVQKGESWYNAHNNSNGSYVDYTGTWIECGTVYFNSIYYLKRSFLPFNVSLKGQKVWPTISSFNFYGYGKKDQDNDSYAYQAVVKTFQASTSTLVSTDYGSCGYDTGNEIAGRAMQTPIVEGSEQLDITSATTTGYNQVKLNSTGASWCQGDWAMLGMREGHDLTDNAITVGPNPTESRIDIMASESSYDPYLSLIYSILGGMV